MSSPEKAHVGVIEVSLKGIEKRGPVLWKSDSGGSSDAVQQEANVTPPSILLLLWIFLSTDMSQLLRCHYQARDCSYSPLEFYLYQEDK